MLPPTNYHLPTKRGFTLIEVLLSIAIISILAGISIPVFQSFQTKNDLDVTANVLAQTIRRAQILSQAVDGDTTWGVNIASTTITLFQGVSYAGRDINYDEDFDLANSITPSGDAEIIFTKFDGELSVSKTITLTPNNGNARNITINQKGIISY